MFKHTTDKMHDIARTGSHSTKPFATGRVEVMPKDARPWEQIFLSLKEQHDLAAAKLEKAYVGLRSCDEKLLATLPSHQYEKTVRIRAGYVDEVTHYKTVCGDLRRDCTQAAKNSLGYCFMEAAKHILTDEQFTACFQSAGEIKAEAPSTSDRLEAAYCPPVLTKLTPAQRTNRNRKYNAILHPERSDAKKAMAKAAKYPGSGAKTKTEDDSPNYVVVHKEF